MKAFVAVLFAVVAAANAGFLSTGLYTGGYGYLPAATSYAYDYRYTTPSYYYAAAPVVKTIAAPAVIAKPATIVREVNTAPITASVVNTAPIVSVAPVVKTVQSIPSTILTTPYVNTYYGAPVVKTIATTPVLSNYAYTTGLGYAPYYGGYVLKK